MDAMKSDLVDIAVQIKHRTDRAILVNDGGTADTWLPLSQVDVSANDDGRSHTVALPTYSSGLTLNYWLLSVLFQAEQGC